VLRAAGRYQGRESCRSGFPGLEIRRILGITEMWSYLLPDIKHISVILLVF
jgi:hypothetical protein